MEKYKIIYKNLPSYISNSNDMEIFEKNGIIYNKIKNSNKKLTYTVSEENHYQTYPYDELKIYFSNKFVYNLMCLIYWIFTFWLNLKDVIYINNMCLSTNLYDKKFFHNLFLSDFNNINDIIAIRSINSYLHKSEIKTLESKGFLKIFSRSINICDSSKIKTKHRKHIQNDKNKFIDLIKNNQLYKIYTYKAKSPIEYVEFEQNNEKKLNEVFNKFISCYKMLYHEKYSEYNPDFTIEWLKLYMSLENTGFIWIEYSGKIIGIIGYYYVDGVLTTPMFGYDIHHNLNKNGLSLYAILSMLIYYESSRLGMIENRSGGCKDFKKQRGAKPTIEYTMIKINHLENKNFDILIKKISWIYLYLLTRILEYFYNN